MGVLVLVFFAQYCFVVVMFLELSVKKEHKNQLTLYHLRLQLAVICDFTYRLVGLVVTASASTAEDPGFESPACAGIFSGVESYQ